MTGDLALEWTDMPPSYGPGDALLPVDLRGGRSLPPIYAYTGHYNFGYTKVFASIYYNSTITTRKSTTYTRKDTNIPQPRLDLG